MKRRLYQAGCAAIVLLSAIAGGRLAQSATAPAQTYRVIAAKFDFSPTVIKVKRGQTVLFELTSIDRVHGFTIPKLKIRKDIIPDEITPVSITFDQAGRFAFNCDNFCGDGHEEMVGVIEVTE